MIDDITIAVKIEGIGDRPTEFMSPLGFVPGRPQQWGSPRALGSLFVTFCPATSVSTVRISVPRWVASQQVNYPLIPIIGVDDLRPHEIAAHALAALGMIVPSDSDPGRYYPVRGAAVTRVSYAADLTVSDPVQVISGCAGLARRNPASFTSWGVPTSTVQWASKSLGVKMYSKGLELATHRTRNEGDVALLKNLVASASKAVRFEVSFRRVRALRDFVGIGNDRLPNLALMCDPRIDRYALGREATRLRLYEPYSLNGNQSYTSTVRHVATVLREAQSHLSNGELDHVGRRKSLTEDRVWDLGAAFFWLSGFPSTTELSTWSGRSRATLDELCAELRELGIPPDGSPSGGLGPAANELAEQLLHYIDVERPDTPEWRVTNGTACAPWGPDDINSEDGVAVDDDDEPTESGVTLADESDPDGPDPNVDIGSVLASVCKVVS